MNAARSLFWILATIEIGIAAVWLALQAASLDSWFAELVRRIMFIGFFAFVLAEGPAFAKAVVDSLFQLGADGGTASPADVFNAGLAVAGKMTEKVSFGLLAGMIIRGSWHRLGRRQPLGRVSTPLGSAYGPDRLYVRPTVVATHEACGGFKFFYGLRLSYQGYVFMSFQRK